MIIILAVLIVGIGGVVYWYRVEISTSYFIVHDSLLNILGLGIVPIAFFLFTFCWSLIYRPSLFRKANVWLGTLLVITSIAGMLTFIDPDAGILMAFVPNIENSLGGKLGLTISGTSTISTTVQVFRVAAIFVVGMSIATPRFAVKSSRMLLTLAVYLYITVTIGYKEATSALTGKRKIDQDSNINATNDNPDTIPVKFNLPINPISKNTNPTTLPTKQDVDNTSNIGTVPLDRPKYTKDYNEENNNPIHPELSEIPLDQHQKSLAAKYNKSWDEPLEKPDDVIKIESPSKQVASTWSLPPDHILVDSPEGGITDAEMTETSSTIKRTLAEYGIEVESGQNKPGPTVTMYGLIPGWVRRNKQVKVLDDHGNPELDETGKQKTHRIETKTRVKVDSILSREKDLSLALKTPSIRIETPVLGESLVGVEVPNPNPTLVSIKRVMTSREFANINGSGKLPIVVGRNSSGENMALDLAQMPHLLVAGSTGSGKSVFINAIISCLIMCKTPSELRLMLVDPKRVELTPYNGIPHLLTPVVVETDEVVTYLKGLIREMQTRYRKMEGVGVRNIQSYNQKMSDTMPYLIVAIDELADLMMSASYDIEQSLCRLAQLGRATGIHLIVATQRPSVDVVTGLIKANFPTRTSFGVTSQIDSRTILDATGAEKLLGKGDMLFMQADASRPERVQGVFISDTEIENLVRHWKNVDWAALPKIDLEMSEDPLSKDQDDLSGNQNQFNSNDEMTDKAINLAHQYKKLSTSLLQRRLRIGYPRAARLMDHLEEKGIVGPSDGSKSRDVIVNQT